MSENEEMIDLSFTQNRELSWLRFNDRVLSEAANKEVPLMERFRFISIFTSNLDEFFMVRVGSLFDLAAIAPKHIDSKSGLTPEEQLENIFFSVDPLYKKRDALFTNVMKELSNRGVIELSYNDLTDEERDYVLNYSREYIKPLFSPQIVDATHPFPEIINKLTYIAASMKDKNKNKRIGLIEIPESAPQIIMLPGDECRYIRTEEFIKAIMNLVFPSYELLETIVFRVTRNADITLDEEKFDDDNIDMISHMKKVLKKRKKLAPVRLEINGNSETLEEMLTKKLSIKKHQVFKCSCPLNLSYAYSLKPKSRDLYYPLYNSRYPDYLIPHESMWNQIVQRDVLLFFPYQSMQPFLDLLKEAANDPEVVSIKMTVYRLAKHSMIARTLCEAAENGKDVTVLMELRARFDEENNIEWAEELEESGCKIIYGREGYKCHSKICLITKKSGNKMSYVTQIGTGNYNEKTSTIYTDLSLMTVDRGIAADAIEFFQNMMIGNLEGNYNELMVAPYSMKTRLFDLIDEEIAKGSKGQIVIKANSVTDRELIDKFSEASCAGVKIILIIRGICCILPNIHGKTDNVMVNSIVGRFLEHSRIYSFGTGEDQKLYIGSADIMTRNQDRRTEIACPIKSPEIKAFINRYIRRSLQDNVNRRVMLPNGEYAMPDSKGKDPFDVQEYYLSHAIHLSKSKTHDKSHHKIKYEAKDKMQDKKLNLSFFDKFFKRSKKK